MGVLSPQVGGLIICFCIQAFGTAASLSAGNYFRFYPASARPFPPKGSASTQKTRRDEKRTTIHKAWRTRVIGKPPRLWPIKKEAARGCGGRGPMQIQLREGVVSR